MNTEAHAVIARAAAELLRRGHPPAQVRGIVSDLGRFAERSPGLVVEIGDVVVRLPAPGGSRDKRQPSRPTFTRPAG